MLLYIPRWLDWYPWLNFVLGNACRIGSAGSWRYGNLRSMLQKISCAPFWDFRPVENSPNWLQHTAIPYVPKVCSDRWEFMTVHLILPELSLHQSGTLISGWVSPTSLQTHPLNGNLSGFEPKSCFVSVNTIARICGNNIGCLLSRRDRKC